MPGKINNIINIIIGGTVGTFAGYSAYMVLNHYMHPERYAYYSAPWYIGIMVYGLFVLMVLIFAVSGKIIIKRKLKNKIK